MMEFSEYISLDLLRGRTFTNAYYIVDEAQNIRPEEIKTLLTRIGKGSKVILSGDPSQTDAKGLNERYNGLTYASELLKVNLSAIKLDLKKKNLFVAHS